MKTSRTFIVLLALAVSGCGGSNHGSSAGGSTTTASAEPTTSTRPASPAPMSIVVYRLRGGTLTAERVKVPRSPRVAFAALGALGLGAPVTIANGTARVDRAGSTAGEVAEIVYTLTQYASIRRVDIAGRTGLTRADIAEFVPPILIEHPVAGDTFDARTVTGTASVFEATLVVELVQNGQTLAKTTATASEGAPARGTFAATFGSSVGAAGPATVVAYAPSAADGSEQHRVEVSVTLP